jgi:cytidyltransferase-like protein
VCYLPTRSPATQAVEGGPAERLKVPKRADGSVQLSQHASRTRSEEHAMEGEDETAGNGARVYVDMVGDLFHAGHVSLLREARRHGDWLIVGVLSDETAASYKRRPIMTLAERVAVIEACWYVDQVIADAPFRVTEEFLDEHAITTVVHGDDLTPEGAESIYGPAVDGERLVYVQRAEGISTTELIQRVHDALARDE